MSDAMKNAAVRTKLKRMRRDWSRVDAMTDAERYAALAGPNPRPSSRFQTYEAGVAGTGTSTVTEPDEAGLLGDRRALEA
jgi:hypothetical protein